MPARFVTTSLVTKRAGIAALFVTLVTERAATVAATRFQRHGSSGGGRDGPRHFGSRGQAH